MSARAEFVRVLPMLVWALLVIGGVLYLVVTRSSSNSLPDVVAATTLLQNSVLRSDVVVRRDVIGKYIVKQGGIKAGETIKAADLSTTPVPPSAPTPRLLLVFPLTGLAASDKFPVGSKLQLCDNSAHSLAPVTVHYIYCASGTRECSATLDIPFDAAVLASKGLQDPEIVKTLRLAESCSE